MLHMMTQKIPRIEPVLEEQLSQSYRERMLSYVM